MRSWSRPTARHRGLADLRGKKIGVAGGPLDKGWLMLQAHARRAAGLDLADEAEPVFGAPPLLTEKLKSGELDAVLNYWHFCARLEAEGYRRLIEIAEVQEALGVPATVPQLGYIFKEELGQRARRTWSWRSPAPSRAAKELMQNDDAEWQRLMPVTRAESRRGPGGLHAPLPRGHRRALGRAGARRRAAASIAVLAELGGEKLVGKGQELAPGTFWPDVSY